MENQMSFAELLEAADSLSLEDQESLVEILRRRVVEYRRTAIAKEIRQADEEFEAGRCQPTTPADLMGEIRS
ncbi:MAG: hypothetical protein GY856_18315 [bacterium]|nr:hypothetical protein [bacterium]